MISSVLMTLLLLAPAPPQGRLRPPSSLSCDRNKLTAFSGSVTQWSRTDSLARLSMSTDADTKESFSIRFDKNTSPEKSFLLEGQVFRTEDWNKVEVSPGKLRTGVQATVWVCEGSANPVVDWRLPPK
jgi:hypothetical protein